MTGLYQKGQIYLKEKNTKKREKMKVVITAKMPEIITNYLEDIRIEMNSSDEPLPAIRLRQMMSDTDALICTSSDVIDRPLMEASPKLKVIVNNDAGTDNIDVDYATHRGITVCNVKHILTQSVSELGFALLMSAARHIPQADKYARNGRFSRNASQSFMTGLDFYKKTLGIYGMGNIGQAVAKIASGFSMDIIYHNRKRNKQAELIFGATYATFDELLEWSDFLLISAPLTTETRHAFSLKEFRKMKKTAVLVNIGRGPIIRENDLATALSEKIIYAAGLDVYEFEPEINEELKKLDNVILAPHIGSSTQATKENMAISCAESVVSVLKGGITPEAAVNKPVII